MIKVLQIREAPESKSDGVDANCQELIKHVGSEDIQMLPTVNYTRHSVPVIHQYYLDSTEICDSIEKLKPNVIHVHGAYSFTLPVAVYCARKYKLPVVFSPHFHPFWSLRRPFMGWLFFHLITKFVLKRVDTVFTINNEDTGIIKKYHSHVVKLPHWSKFDVAPILTQKKKNMILFVGRLDESNKGFEHLYHLPEGKYEIHCVGKGEIINRSDIVKHQNISDLELRDLYREASLLVVPSRYEAFSYVALEALLCGTPIVVSDRVRIVDHLKDPTCYCVFNYQDYQSFESAVAKTIGNKVDVELVSKTFSSERISQLYRNEYLKFIMK